MGFLEQQCLKSLGSAGQNTTGMKKYTDSQVNVLQDMFTELYKWIDEVIADTYQDSVKFIGFGFRRAEEAFAWVDIHMPDYKFGLIVDVHMVFEHLSSLSAKTITTLQQLIKIDMKDMSQGVAEAAGYTVVKTDESFFDKVKTYREWEEPHTGYRDRLKNDLTSFDLAHKQLVVDNTDPGSALQGAASMPRTYSVSWIEAFIVFIDETYSELTRAKFSSARGWSLITRLAFRILFEVSAPRNGFKQTFITGRHDIIAKQIFWAVIRSQDIMAAYKDKSFQNDPLVSAEYVKFLIMNTGMDIIDQLVKRNTVLEEKVTG
jgi:hypothetical protein